MEIILQIVFFGIGPIMIIYFGFILPIKGAVEDVVRIHNKDTTYLNDPNIWTICLAIVPWLILTPIILAIPMELFHVSIDSTAGNIILFSGTFLGMVPAWLIALTIIRFFIRKKIPSISFNRNSAVPV